jgi:hypothetical protein
LGEELIHVTHNVTDNVTNILGEELIHVSRGRSLFMSRGGVAYTSRCLNMPKHAQTCQSPPDVYSVAVMTQSLMSQT